ncbi:hypothetical protein A2154_01475 [Candidatus Gottesmanbacteria bacterium RBG_16_43_7]|uniref:Methyltransferase domain-containing protein n=1 Tax=Candidatus Gottesmanbacteria bacterium RBG_16_43_7 TaxID=1798373 RepID=A0A1F5ZAS4_9BACT|nr:MAG: hypothetical protein A2154_01475 [Candidatus Gottesmanbacteria bacterium RBG_16_43_7]
MGADTANVDNQIYVGQAHGAGAHNKYESAATLIPENPQIVLFGLSEPADSSRQKIAYIGSDQLTPELIPNFEIATLIRSLVQAGDNGWIPSLAQAQALLCTWYLDNVPMPYVLEDEIANKSKDGTNLPWPQPFNKQIMITDKKGHYIDGRKRQIIASGNGSVFNDIKDSDDADPLFYTISTLVSKMNQEDHADLGIWILDNWDLFASYIGEFNNAGFKLYNLTADGLETNNNALLSLGNKLVEFIHYKTKLTDVMFYNTRFFEGSNEEEFMSQLRYDDDTQKLIYEALIREKWGDDITKDVFRKIFLNNQVPTELNIMRKLLEYGGLSDTQRMRLEKLMRPVLGLLSDLPIYSKLEDLYAEVNKKIGWENVSRSTTMRENHVQMLLDIFEKYKIPANGLVLELGSGTGELAAEIRKRGYKILGLEKSEVNFRKATRKFGQFYILGDWNKLIEIFTPQKMLEISQKFTSKLINQRDLQQMDRTKFAACISTGHTLPHAESEQGVDQFIENIVQKIVPGGLIVLDSPDPTCGEYQQKVLNYRKVLISQGYDPRVANNKWYIVDSPDGTNYYNRIILPRDWLESKLRKKNVIVLDVIYTPIPGTKKDRTMTFVCQYAPLVRYKSRPIFGEDDITLTQKNTK